MTVIAVCNQKGGSGKTTLAINLDRAFAADGMGVLLLDIDPQGSALDWGSIDPATGPPFEVAEIAGRSCCVRRVPCEGNTR